MTDTNNQKVAWITGASRGIGRALALNLAEKGWTVAASARSETDLINLKSRCLKNTIHSFPMDVTDLQMTKLTVRQIEAGLGPIKLAILNAGIHDPVSISNFSVAAFRLLMETNFMGTVNGLSEILPNFIERKSGQIAVVGSMAGYRGLPTAAAYGATKAGLINMCESIKPELEKHKIHLKLINPGFVKTPLTDQNNFPMPFIISAEAAAERIVKGLEEPAFEIKFPLRFALAMKLLQLMPYRLFFQISRKMLSL